MISARALIIEFFIYGLSGTLSRFFGLLLVPVFTRTLDTSHFGAFEITTVVMILLTLLLGVQTESGLVRFYAIAKEKQEEALLASTVFWVWTFVGVIGSAGLIFCAPLASKWLYGELADEGIIWLRILAITVFFHLQFQQLKHLLLLEHKAKRFAAINIIPVIVITAISLPAVYLGYGVTGILVGFLLGYLIGFIFMYLSVRQYLRLKFSLDYFKEVMPYSLPFLPATGLAWGQRHGVRLIIVGSMSLTDVGVYGVANTIALVVSMINMAFRQTWVPRSTAIMHKDDAAETYAKIFNLYLLFMIVLVSSLLIINPLVLQMIAPKGYWQAEYLSPWLISGMVYIGMFEFAALGNLIAKKSFRNLVGVAAAASFTLGGSWIVLHYYKSLLMVAVIFFVSQMLGFYLTIWSSNRIVKVPFRKLVLCYSAFSLTILPLAATYCYWCLYVIAPVVLFFYAAILSSQERGELLLVWQKIKVTIKKVYRDKLHKLLFKRAALNT